MSNLIQDPERWANDGTGAISLRFARDEKQVEELSKSEKQLVSSFHPRFVYPLFGEEETIYGYDDLDVQLVFNSSNLKNYLSINYKAKLPESSTINPDEIESVFYNFIPPDYTKSKNVFEDELKSESSFEFKPPGKKISSYRSIISEPKGKQKNDNHFLNLKRWSRCKNGEEEDEEEVIYELWSANWTTPGFKEYHRRMQILVLFYIEGGSYIDEDDSRWEFVMLFERRKHKKSYSREYTYHFCGYVSLYSFYHYPSSIRLRLSQFIIIPPYQSNGHGSMLYEQIFQSLLEREEVTELTIEDPSESFEDLRDKSDLKLLMNNQVFERDLDRLIPLDQKWSQETRIRWKLAERQFARLYELALRWRFTLGSEEASPKLERLYRLGVKERLYRFNYDSLVNISKEERREKLQDTFEGVMDHYDRLLRGERREID